MNCDTCFYAVGVKGDKACVVQGWIPCTEAAKNCKDISKGGEDKCQSTQRK